MIESVYKKESPDGMFSILDLYKIGSGPSSSHSIGPETAAGQFRSDYPDADGYKVILYGSLAYTGKGHHTDKVIEKAFSPLKVSIEFNTEKTDLPHPNTMEFYALKNGAQTGFRRVFSVGGGDIVTEGAEPDRKRLVYPETSFDEIKDYCTKKAIRIWQYVEEREGKDIWKGLSEIWQTMKGSISDGLNAEGVLEGGLNIMRKAGFLYNQTHIDESAETRENRIVCAYAFAVSEQNAAGCRIVTAPTCGSAGVLPAVLLYEQEKRGYSDEKILRALAAAGIIGNLIKTNASISGAQCGCQAEIGSACSMAAAALAELFDMRISQIEYAAEVAMEHHLGLTCDPIKGLVQIPCIERNAVAAMRAINAVNLANFLTNTRKISFDLIIRTMYETGRDLSSNYKETSRGGLAKLYE